MTGAGSRTLFHILKQHVDLGVRKINERSLAIFGQLGWLPHVVVNKCLIRLHHTRTDVGVRQLVSSKRVILIRTWEELGEVDLAFHE
mgnify:CR=1 FL=1